MIIAIDYDLTIINDKGELIDGAKDTINKLKTDDHFIIIWTSREGESQQEARQNLTDNEIQFDTINENKPGIPNDPRKVIADIYIDEKNINGIPDWTTIYETITSKKRSTMTLKPNQIARCIDGKASIRAADGKNYIEWYASVFNQPSKLIREWGEVFFEIIAPEAFTNTLADPGLNCLATVDHARHKMLGRNKSGTLTLSVDDYGLFASVEVPNTNLGRDMIEMINRGDYFEGSFIYTIAEKGVSYDTSGEIPVRTVSNIADLYDVSIVIDGAFANTAIKMRSVEFNDDGTETPEPPEIVPPSEQEPPETPETENDPNILLKMELEIIILKK